jgi:hypothetical protein
MKVATVVMTPVFAGRRRIALTIPWGQRDTHPAGNRLTR